MCRDLRTSILDDNASINSVPVENRPVHKYLAGYFHDVSDLFLNYSLICKWAAIGRCWGFSYHSLLSINCNAAKTKIKHLFGTMNHVFKKIWKICTNRNCTMHVKLKSFSQMTL